MGVGHSKFQEKYFTDIELNSDNAYNDLEASERTLNENQNLTMMRQLMKHRMDYFLINNLLLSVQFFENYERDMAELRLNADDFEDQQINERLQQFEKKHCLMPDSLHSQINKNVAFKFQKETQQFINEPLHTQRMIISPDNIKVYSPTEGQDNPLPTSINYTMKIEQTNLQGYVRLNVKTIVDSPNFSDESSISSTRNSTPTPGEVLLNEIQNKIDSQPSTTPFKIPLSIKSNHSTLSDDDYSDDVFLPNKTSSLTKTQRRLSGTISKEMQKVAAQAAKFRRFNPPKLKRIKKEPPRFPIKNNSYDHCITEIETKNLNMNVYEEIGETRRNQNDQKAGKFTLFKTKRYFNAVKFTDSFGDMFSSNLGNVLGFSNFVIGKSIMQQSTIYSEVYQGDYKVNYEIIPSLKCSWPDLAYAWTMRDRPMLVDHTTEMTYRWPTKKMVERITSLPCLIYPLGCLDEEKEIDTDFPLQWRMMFPHAEKFLETCFTHTQMRCYLFILAFYKTVLEPRTSKLGLTENHIRSLMFWECERNYLDWNEERLGEKLFFLFKKLRQHLQNQNQEETLRDYFLPSRNLFENTPIKHLLIAQRSLVDIIENPVMFTLKTLNNLKYLSPNFYPTLNYLEIYSIITSENILERINPNIRVVQDSTDSAFEENSSDDEKNDEDLDETSKWNKLVYEQIQKEKRQMQTKPRKHQKDFINVNFKLTEKIDSIKLMLILRIFIEHFIKMASKCYTFKCYDQGLMYVQHAENLSILFREETQDEVSEFLDQIRHVEQQIQNSLFDIRIRNLSPRGQDKGEKVVNVTTTAMVERYIPLKDDLPFNFENDQLREKDNQVENTTEVCYESIKKDEDVIQSEDDEIESSHV